jgi:hypothetical protein
MPTVACVPGRGQKVVRNTALLVNLPEEFTGVRRITFDGGALVIARGPKDQPIRVRASRLGEILLT